MSKPITSTEEFYNELGETACSNIVVLRDVKTGKLYEIVALEEEEEEGITLIRIQETK